jgi:hypothetical protein
MLEGTEIANLRLFGSQDTRGPDLAEGLSFRRLLNVEPWRSSLHTVPSYAPIKDDNGNDILLRATEEPIYAGAILNLAAVPGLGLFVFTEHGVFGYDGFSVWEDLREEYFHRIETFGIFDSDPPKQKAVSVLVGYDGVYAISNDLPLRKYESVSRGATPTVIPYVSSSGQTFNIRANFIASAQNHIFVGGDLSYSVNNRRNRLLWSEINTDHFTDISVSSGSDSDEFDLDPEGFDITGLAVSRGQLYALNRNSVWRADYNPLPTGYRFSIVASNCGCHLPNAVVSHQDVLYWAGFDTMFAMNGDQVSRIGDPIYDEIKGELKSLSNRWAYIYKVLSRQKIVFAVQTESNYVLFQYNYNENAWSRLAETTPVLTSIELSAPFDSDILWNEVAIGCEEPDTQPDYLWTTLPVRTGNFQSLFGGLHKSAPLVASNEGTQFDEFYNEVNIETAFLPFDSTKAKKEIDCLQILHKTHSENHPETRAVFPLSVEIIVTDDIYGKTKSTVCKPWSTEELSKSDSDYRMDTFYCRPVSGRFIKLKFSGEIRRSNLLQEIVSVSLWKLNADGNSR